MRRQDVGRIGLADHDTVTLDNLARQILHRTEDLGRLKVDSGADSIFRLCPKVAVDKIPLKLTRKNTARIIAPYDVIIDGSDNLAFKLVLNDACALSGKPWVMGGVLRFFGQIMTILPGESACLRCLVGEEGAGVRGLDCGDAGVLGAVAGLRGHGAGRRCAPGYRGACARLVEQADDGRFLEQRLWGLGRGAGPGLSGLRARRAQSNQGPGNPRGAGSARLAHEADTPDERISPMKISTKGRYAVLAMIELARHSQTHPVPLPQIAGNLDISQHYLEQLFVKMRRASLVSSTRGPGGGYILALPPSRINMRDVLSAVEETIQPVDCGETPPSSPCPNHCGVRKPGFVEKTRGRDRQDAARNHAGGFERAAYRCGIRRAPAQFPGEHLASTMVK